MCGRNVKMLTKELGHHLEGRILQRNRMECISTKLRGVARRDVMSLTSWASEGIASWSSCISWFMAMGTRSGTYILVASSVNCAVPIFLMAFGIGLW
jgi:hypothetical protein